MSCPPPPPPSPPPASVSLTDDDAGSALYAVANAAPGQGVERCIRVSYAGGAPAEVRLYTTTAAVGALAPYLDLVVTPGTLPAGGAPGCAGFAPVASPMFAGTLSGFAAGHWDWEGGLTAPTGAARWSPGDTVAFRVALTLADDGAANGGSAGPLSARAHGYVWEARTP
jgi:hypothetical protein